MTWLPVGVCTCHDCTCDGCPRCLEPEDDDLEPENEDYMTTTPARAAAGEQTKETR